MLFQFLRSAVVLTLATLRVRQWRTSCEMVGTGDAGSFPDRDEMGSVVAVGTRPAGATVGVFDFGTSPPRLRGPWGTDRAGRGPATNGECIRGAESVSTRPAESGLA